MTDLFRTVFFPQRCVLCGEAAAENTPFCEKCGSEVEKLFRTPCQRCGRAASLCRCVPAALYPEKVETVHLFAYDTALSKRLVFLLKRRNIRILRSYFGEKLSKTLEKAVNFGEISEFDITFAPRMAKSVRLYGFDQAKSLCKEVSRRLSLPMITLFVHTHGGEEQKEKSAADRAENAEKSYSLASKYAGERRGNKGEKRGLILVDDVMTTGSTMKSLVSLAKEAGYERILCVTVAKTVFKRK